jgi:phage major head subunit gpT-like protein
MPALTPSFVFDLQSNMTKITESEYARRSAKLWWSKLAKVRTTGAGREILHWLLSTATIKNTGASTDVTFEDLVGLYKEITPDFASTGLRLKRHQLEDTDANGVNLASQWARDIGEEMSYYPQRAVVAAVNAGSTTLLGYDGLALFHAAHPYNPFDTAAGTYSNIITAAPLDTTNAPTLDAAVASLQKVFTHLATIKQANGKDPRGLTPGFILCGPVLYPRAVQATQAKFFGQAAGVSGVATADTEALIGALGFGQPVLVPEFVGGNWATEYLVVVDGLEASQLGALIYLEREAFRVSQYAPTDQAELNQMDEFRWIVRGRSGVGAGHPYLAYLCKPT